MGEALITRRGGGGGDIQKVTGTYTPDDNMTTFTVSGLSFEPKGIEIHGAFSKNGGSSPYPIKFVYGTIETGVAEVVAYCTHSSSGSYNTLTTNQGTISYGNNSVTVTIPKISNYNTAFSTWMQYSYTVWG